MTKNEVEKIPIVRITEGCGHKIEDMVATEFSLTIILNDQELVTLLCSPNNLDYLAIGFLSSEGLIKSKDEIRKIVVDDRRGVVRVEIEKDNQHASELLFKRFAASGCGRGASFYSAVDVQGQSITASQTSVTPPEVIALVKEFHHASLNYKTTGGVHSAALCDTKNIIVFCEDIGRHNAIDKVFGECMLTDIPTNDCIIVTSGRISSEILLKVTRKGIPILISKSAPTDMGVNLANDLGVTLIGFVRGKRMNVYTNEWRVVTDGK